MIKYAVLMPASARFGFIAVAASAVLAADALPNSAIAAGSVQIPPAGPVFTDHSAWLWAVLFAIGALFVLAAALGPLVRREMPEELPLMHSHDEPPGSSGHHGRSGTANPMPPDDHPQGRP
jgi:hypothetical protein